MVLPQSEKYLQLKENKMAVSAKRNYPWVFTDHV